MTKKLKAIIPAACAVLTLIAFIGCAGSPPGSTKLDRTLFNLETNYVAAVVAETNAQTGEITRVTNIVEVVQLGATKAGAKEAIETGGAIGSLYTPWAGFGATGLLGLLAVYREVRNRRTAAALVQGIETGRQLLTTTPQGQDLMRRYTDWLKKHQREVGVITQVSKLVDTYADSDAAKGVAQLLTENK